MQKVRRRGEKRAAGWLCLAGFLACVWLANYSITHWGSQPFPGGPHTVTLLGWTAPSGVLLVGLAFSLRDGVQLALGWRWVVGAIIVGAGLAALTAGTDVALASGVAFLVSEGLDALVYTPLANRGRWVLGVALSNSVGAIVDSVLFLAIAFHSLDFLEGQVALKTLMMVPALVLVGAWRARRAR